MIAVIAAIDNAGGYSKENKIPWHYPEDFKFFKTITKKSSCIMGFNTFMDILSNYNKPNSPLLKNRRSIIITKKHEHINSTLSNVITYATDDLSYAIDYETAIHSADHSIFLIGGVNLFSLGISKLADVCYITEIQKNYNCDKFFPIDMLYKKFHTEHVNIVDDLHFIKYKRK